MKMFDICKQLINKYLCTRLSRGKYLNCQALCPLWFLKIDKDWHYSHFSPPPPPTKKLFDFYSLLSLISALFLSFPLLSLFLTLPSAFFLSLSSLCFLSFSLFPLLSLFAPAFSLAPALSLLFSLLSLYLLSLYLLSLYLLSLYLLSFFFLSANSLLSLSVCPLYQLFFSAQ